VIETEVSLGEFLRREREKRSISIEQVSSATKIGVKTLHFLEADRYVDLPSQPFIRGFVVSYCRFVGLDAQEVLARFDAYIVRRSVERPNRDSGHSGYAFDKKDGDQPNRAFLTIAIASFLGLGGIAFFILKPSLRHHRHSHIDKLREARPVILSEPLPSPALLEKPVEKPVEKPSEEIDVEKSSTAHTIDLLDSGVELKGNEIRHKLISKTLEDVWVRYQADDRPMRKFIVRKGKILVLRAREKVWLQVSHPDFLLVNYNNHTPEIMTHLGPILIHDTSTLTYFRASAEEVKSWIQSVIDKLATQPALPQVVDPAIEKSNQNLTPKN
jgi:cytoskeletal protein RodZ